MCTFQFVCKNTAINTCYISRNTVTKESSSVKLTTLQAAINQTSVEWLGDDAAVQSIAAVSADSADLPESASVRQSSPTLLYPDTMKK